MDGAPCGLADMCIATSWTSYRVAVLVSLCDFIVLILNFYLVRSSSLQMAMPSLAASSMAVLAAVALATFAKSPMQRGSFATALVTAFILHSVWLLKMRSYTQKIDVQLSVICSSQSSQPPQDFAAISSLMGLAASSGHLGSGLDPARIATDASTVIQDLTLQQQAMRERMGPRPGESEAAASERARKGKLQVCKLGYVQSVFGSLLQLISATTTLGGVAMLLEFVCFSKCWCEETPAGRRFRRWMFDDDLHVDDADKLRSE